MKGTYTADWVIKKLGRRKKAYSQVYWTIRWRMKPRPRAEPSGVNASIRKLCAWHYEDWRERVSPTKCIEIVNTLIDEQLLAADWRQRLTRRELVYVEARAA